MKKFAQIFFVLLLSVSWATAQEAKKPAYEPASLETTPATIPSPTATPTPEVIERIVNVPIYVPMPAQVAQAESAVKAPAQDQKTQTQVPKLLVDQARKLVQQEAAKIMASGGEKSKEMSAMISSDYHSYGLSRPPVVLESNKGNFHVDETLQTRLRVVDNLRRGAVYRFSVCLEDFNSFKIREVGTRTFVQGETIQIQTYVWDGSEPRGLYIYGVFVVDQNGQITAQAVGNFVFGQFGQYSNEYYVRVDSAEMYKSSGWVHLRGNFFPSNFDPRFHQYVSIDGQMYSVAFATNTDAWVFAPLSPGSYDITWIAWYESNTSYDSVTAPSVLKVYQRPDYGRG